MFSHAVPDCFHCISFFFRLILNGRCRHFTAISNSGLCTFRLHLTCGSPTLCAALRLVIFVLYQPRAFSTIHFFSFCLPSLGCTTLFLFRYQLCISRSIRFLLCVILLSPFAVSISFSAILSPRVAVEYTWAGDYAAPAAACFLGTVFCDVYWLLFIFFHCTTGASSVRLAAFLKQSTVHFVTTVRCVHCC